MAFDPLDGSSIVDANFAVGSIFGIWPGDGLLGRRGRDQAAAAYAVYGPRTILVIALPQHGEGEHLSIQLTLCAKLHGNFMSQKSSMIELHYAVRHSSVSVIDATAVRQHNVRLK